jgi:hypothetical protein
LAYLNTIVWPTAAAIAGGQASERKLLALRMMGWWFYSLTFSFLRPRVVTRKLANPQDSYWVIVKALLLAQDAPPSPSQRRRQQQCSLPSGITIDRKDDGRGKSDSNRRITQNGASSLSQQPTSTAISVVIVKADELMMF